jgi:hypothetical protein
MRQLSSALIFNPFALSLSKPVLSCIEGGEWIKNRDNTKPFILRQAQDERFCVVRVHRSGQASW